MMVYDQKTEFIKKIKKSKNQKFSIFSKKSALLLGSRAGVIFFPNVFARWGSGGFRGDEAVAAVVGLEAA